MDVFWATRLARQQILKLDAVAAVRDGGGAAYFTKRVYSGDVVVNITETSASLPNGANWSTLQAAMRNVSTGWAAPTANGVAHLKDVVKCMHLVDGCDPRANVVLEALGDAAVLRVLQEVAVDQDVFCYRNDFLGPWPRLLPAPCMPLQLEAGFPSWMTHGPPHDSISSLNVTDNMASFLYVNDLGVLCAKTKLTAPMLLPCWGVMGEAETAATIAETTLHFSMSEKPIVLRGDPLATDAAASLQKNGVPVACDGEAVWAYAKEPPVEQPWNVHGLLNVVTLNLEAAEDVALAFQPFLNMFDKKYPGKKVDAFPFITLWRDVEQDQPVWVVPSETLSSTRLGTFPTHPFRKDFTGVEDTEQILPIDNANQFLQVLEQLVQQLQKVSKQCIFRFFESFLPNDYYYFPEQNAHREITEANKMAAAKVQDDAWSAVAAASHL